MECEGKIVSIVKSQIPYTNVLTVECEDGRKIEMSIHDELLNLEVGENVTFVISEELPEYKDGIDLCGRGVFYKEDNNKKLFSIGGFVVAIWHDKGKYEIGKKYYICLRHNA